MKRQAVSEGAPTVRSEMMGRLKTGSLYKVECGNGDYIHIYKYELSPVED